MESWKLSRTGSSFIGNGPSLSCVVEGHYLTADTSSQHEWQQGHFDHKGGAYRTLLPHSMLGQSIQDRGCELVVPVIAGSLSSTLGQQTSWLQIEIRTIYDSQVTDQKYPSPSPRQAHCNGR
jgi:hypothetical protein